MFASFISGFVLLTGLSLAPAAASDVEPSPEPPAPELLDSEPGSEPGPAPAADSGAELDPEPGPDCPACPEPSCPESDEDAPKTAKAIEKAARTKCGKKPTRPEKRACRKARMAHWRSYPHRGVIAEVNGALGGCVGTICGQNLDTGVGGGVGAFVGGNLFGFAEIGASLSWRGMSIRSGGNPLADHGVDPTGFANAAARRNDDPDAIAADLEALEVGAGKAGLFFAGAEARVHFLPAGRGELYLGSGLGLARWRARYSGPDVEVRMTGFGVPVVLGGGYYIKRFLIVNLQLQYMYTSPRFISAATPSFDGDTFREALREWDAVSFDDSGAAPQFIGGAVGIKFRI